MKILLLTLPRTGSTSLINSLHRTLNIPKYSIPDCYRYPKDYKLIEHCLSTQNVILRMSSYHNVGESLESFSNNFDKVLILSRKNIEEHYISVANLFYKEVILDGDCFGSYSTDEIPTKILTDFKKSTDWLRIQQARKDLKTLSEKIKALYINYEDLYHYNNTSRKISEYLNISDIDTFKYNLNVTNKMRIERKKVLF